MNFLTALTNAVQLFGAGRSPAMLLNVAVPRIGYGVARDIAYGATARHRLDVYRRVAADPPPSVLPHKGGEERSVAPSSTRARDHDGLKPVVVFFYGGGFRSGRKSEYRFVGEALTSTGMVVAIPDYRIYPEARFPDFLEDGARAVKKVRELVAQFGGDPDRIFLAGHSAGAYIAVMLASNDRWLNADTGDAPWLRGVIALSGRYHDGPLQDEIAEKIFAGPARGETRPATFIRRPSPAMLIAAGGRESHDVLNSKACLAAHLRAHGNEVEEVVYPRIGHTGIIAALAPGFRRRAPVRSDIARFVAGH
jgi:acetyl esterase/lipase